MNSIHQQLIQARQAKKAMGMLTLSQKKQLLQAISELLVVHQDAIISENKKDLDRMDPQDPKYDRLKLTADRIQALADSVIDVANLDDPTGKVLLQKTLENGLQIEKRSVALGVVGVIYESRPNVTVDVVALCIQSGNVCLLRGGSDAWFTNNHLVSLIRQAIETAGINPDIVQLLPTARELMGELLTAKDYVDILIPRGSQALIDYVRDHAKVPVIETGAGVCHTYVDGTADLDKAARIVANAKISRPSVCNALDTVLVDQQVAGPLLSKLVPYFAAHQVEVYADPQAFQSLEDAGYPHLQHATEDDFGREFLDLKCSVKVVEGLEDALDHIATYSSKHSECIVSTDPAHIDTFLQTVDAAAVYANASTRFTDGGEFGLGAEIGISTQKLHARGPFALEKLVTEKWVVKGDGQIR
ncbi:glutamate-5-semialdehyde dehydrogenase [Parapedobacter sp. GCM10030251]|uniref:glutamate-5-semialdehyde dehydrogenase n=1 Tax=Parapedobacter sp. GCM10030251 TaxID=3273419 RepID=UPI0036076E36